MRVLPLLAFLAACQGDPCKESGTACALVGDGQAGYNGDGIKASDARLYYPMDVVAWPGKDAYVIVDWNNERIREVDEDGVINTVVGRDIPGDGAPDGADKTLPGAPGTNVSLNHPVQAEFGPDGDLYIAAWHNHKIRRWDPVADKVHIVVANTDPGDGSGSNAGFAGDGGPAEAALVWFPSSVAFAPDGSYYLSDEHNLRIRHVDVDGDTNISTFAGCGIYGDVDGDPLTAQFRMPDDPATPQPLPGGEIETDADGNIFVADTYNHQVRKVDAVTGVVTTIAGTGVPGYSGDGGPAMDAQFDQPRDLEFGPDGRLYVADSANNVIRAIDLTSGTVDTVVGTGDVGMGDDGAPALERALNGPYGLDFTDDGTMLIADTFNSLIVKVTP